MSMLEGVDLAAIGNALGDANVDGWLLYDFRGINPVARRILKSEGMATRRLFVYLPADGSEPIAVAHRIELQALEGFPGSVRPYAAWQELHESLRGIVAEKTVAMEVSPLDEVPYLDWVPHGVVQLINDLGGTVVSSSDLVTGFAARVTPREMDEHCKAAELIASIARHTLRDVVTEMGVARETTVRTRVLDAIANAGLVTSHPPLVAFGENAANPHYEPHEGADRLLEKDQVILLDLWGGTSRPSVFADQTWMGFSGSAPPADVASVWDAVKGARKAVVAKLRALDGNQEITGAELDDVARGVIADRGYADAFVHRTGHSIDHDLHGIGPHLDNYETHDIRVIPQGVAFSIEPGIYLPDRFGVRSEINVVMQYSGPHPTPKEPQEELILVS